MDVLKPISGSSKAQIYKGNRYSRASGQPHFIQESCNNANRNTELRHHPHHAPPTNMLFTGMCTVSISKSVTIRILFQVFPSTTYEISRLGVYDVHNFTKYPSTPMTTKPMPTAWLILRNSRLSGLVQRLMKFLPSLEDRTRQNGSGKLYGSGECILEEFVRDIEDLL